MELEDALLAAFSDSEDETLPPNLAEINAETTTALSSRPAQPSEGTPSADSSCAPPTEGIANSCAASAEESSTKCDGNSRGGNLPESGAEASEETGKSHYGARSKAMVKALEEKKKRLIAACEKDAGPRKHRIDVAAKFAGPSFFDCHSGYTIGNPIITKEELKARMDGKKNVVLSTLASQVRNGHLMDINFVVFGVVAKKVDPRVATNGTKFAVFVLSDLGNTSVRLLVFGDENYTKLWKEREGLAVGVLNPRIRMESEPCLSISDARCVLILGTCLEFGYCQSTAKNSTQRCRVPINKGVTDFCEHHLTAAFKQMKSRRAEVQGAGQAPRRVAQRRQDRVAANRGNFRPPPSGGQVGDGLRVAGGGGRVREGRNATSATIEEIIKTPTAGALNLGRARASKVPGSINDEESDQVFGATTSARTLLDAHRAKLATNQSTGLSANQSAGLSANQSAGPDEVLLTGSPGGVIKRTMTVAELRKLKAAKLLKRKAEPGSAAEAGSARSEKVMRRVAENIAGRESDVTVQVVMPSSSPEEELIAQVLSTKSRFSALMDAEERAREEAYFSAREKKEAVLERMAETTEIKARAVTCHSCRYIAPSLAEKCKKEKHAHKWSEETKRFFECGVCKARTVSYRRYPTARCRNCNGNNFHKTGMVHIPDVPILHTEFFKIADAEGFS